MSWLNLSGLSLLAAMFVFVAGLHAAVEAFEQQRLMKPTRRLSHQLLTLLKTHVPLSAMPNRQPPLQVAQRVKNYRGSIGGPIGRNSITKSDNTTLKESLMGITPWDADSWPGKLWTYKHFTRSVEVLSSLPYKSKVRTQLRTEGYVPPFYDGPLPVKFIYDSVYIGYPLAIDIPIVTRHPEWEHIYIYQNADFALDKVPQGVVTINPATRRLLAEAKFVRCCPEYIIEEYHYALDGTLSFRCTSTINIHKHVKTNERRITGKKERDYYFVYPVFGW